MLDLGYGSCRLSADHPPTEWYSFSHHFSFLLPSFTNSCDLNHNGNMLLTVKRTFPISRLLPPRTLRPLGIFRPQSTISTSHSPTTTPASSVTNAPLSALPTTSLLRSLLLHSITSSPRTLELGMKVMLANLETIDKNFLLKWGVDKTFYVSTKPFRSFGWCSC